MSIILTNSNKFLVIANKLKVSENILKANKLDYLIVKAEMQKIPDAETFKNMIIDNNMELKQIYKKATIAHWLSTHDRLHYTFKDIPENVIDVDLSMQDLEELPDFITELSSLQFLRLTRNRLTELPNSIGNLTNLKQLWVDSNRLKSIPESIKNLTKLTFIDISNNPLSKEEKNKTLQYCEYIKANRSPTYECNVGMSK